MALKVYFTIGIILSLSIATLSPAYGADLEFHPKAERLLFSLMGPFVRLNDSSILAIDETNCWISHDNGKSWGSQGLFTDEQQDCFNLKVSNERAIQVTKSGIIIAAFMDMNAQKWTWQDELRDAPGAILPTYVMRSLDNGRTWQDIQKLHDDWTGAVRDMIETHTGRIVFTTMKMLHSPGRHAVLTYSSIDDGATWEPSNIVDLGGVGHHAGAMEAALVELNDQSVWKLIRTNLMEFWSAYSQDGGRHWRELKPSGIPASSAPAALERLKSGRLCLVWNRPFPEGQGDYERRSGDGIWSEVPVSNHRGELSIAFSDDDGRNWSKPEVLCRKPGESLAYPYVFEASPGELWITTMQGRVRIRIHEADFIQVPK